MKKKYKGKTIGMLKIRKNELSLYNIFLCFLVILIHVSSEPITLLQKTSWQYPAVFIPWKLSSVAVYGFIFLSGLKLFLSPPEKLGRFYLRKLTRIVLPYLFWVVIYYNYFVGRDYFPFRISDLLRYVFIGNLSAHFYFIVIIVQFYLLTPLWLRLKKTNPFVSLFVAFLMTAFCGLYLPALLRDGGIDFQYNDRVFTSYLFFWVAGCFAGMYYERFVAYLREKRRAVTLLFLLAAAGEVCLSYRASCTGAFPPYLGLLHFIYLTAAVPFLMAVFVRLARVIPVGGFLKTLDYATYYIYLVHVFVLLYINKWMADAGVTDIGKAFFIRLIGTYVISISLCMLYVFLKKRLRDAGKRMKQKETAI